MASEMPFARMVAFWLGSTDAPPTAPKDLISPVTVPRSPESIARLASSARYEVRALTLGSSRRAASSIAACTSSSGRFTLTRPACTMRARGALAAEHIFTAFATSPARMHFCIVARKTSLLIVEPYRYSARSMMMPIVMIDQRRIGYIPQPPSLKCFQMPAIWCSPPGGIRQETCADRDFDDPRQNEKTRRPCGRYLNGRFESKLGAL